MDRRAFINLWRVGAVAAAGALALPYVPRRSFFFGPWPTTGPAAGLTVATSLPPSPAPASLPEVSSKGTISYGTALIDVLTNQVIAYWPDSRPFSSRIEIPRYANLGPATTRLSMQSRPIEWKRVTISP